MTKNRFTSSLLVAAMVIPTQSLEGWKHETFSRIPSNQIAVSEKGLLVQVKKSASPLIYKLKSQEEITAIQISGEFISLPQFSDLSRQGKKGADDFALRLGLIVPGEKKLTGVKKLFAPEWVKQLYKQVPEESGLDHIYFFNIIQNSKLLGQTRQHPGSDLIQEEFIAVVNQPGPFVYTHQLKQPMKTLALWISIDGDDTASSFDVLLSKIELTTADSKVKGD